MSEPKASFSVNVDVTNPGQFFACCGLLELAHRLWPGTEGWFELGSKEFCLAASTDGATLTKLITKLSQCTIEGLTAQERRELDELERHKRELRKAKRALSDAEERRRVELGHQAREGRLVLGDFQLTLDWWQEDGTPATWAGKQEIHKIGRAAQDAMAQCMADRQPLSDLLNWQRVLRTPSEYRSDKGIEKKVEPFYFDARRYAHPLDEGFSLDIQGAETVANPATEFLCLVGLQRFRPKQSAESRWTLEYTTWAWSLGVREASAVTIGCVTLPSCQRFSFAMQFRDDQKRYKAFGFARKES